MSLMCNGVKRNIALKNESLSLSYFYFTHNIMLGKGRKIVREKYIFEINQSIGTRKTPLDGFPRE